ncbi:phosphoribosyltransferase family protein [bacterium]|jgi:hypoxanthine phosphoribosyltransferase|nr:phosphoribosyltransferase family protein [bacterium]
MRELFKPKEIQFQTKIIGKQIADDHRGDKTPIVMVGLLNGAFAFYSDLVRATPVDMECDFMRVKSYTNRKQGDIVISKDLETPIKGKHVYIVDDILDSGNTMNAVIDYLEVKKPASISIVTLITRETSPIPKQKSYHAFTIKDEWIVGMGMDNDKGHMRNIPSIWAL